jgi:hypothetical protein
MSLHRSSLLSTSVTGLPPSVISPSASSVSSVRRGSAACADDERTTRHDSSDAQTLSSTHMDSRHVVSADMSAAVAASTLDSARLAPLRGMPTRAERALADQREESIDDQSLSASSSSRRAMMDAALASPKHDVHTDGAAALSVEAAPTAAAAGAPPRAHDGHRRKRRKVEASGKEDIKSSCNAAHSSAEAASVSGDSSSSASAAFLALLTLPPSSAGAGKQSTDSTRRQTCSQTASSRCIDAAIVAASSSGLDPRSLLRLHTVEVQSVAHYLDHTSIIRLG